MSGSISGAPKVTLTEFDVSDGTASTLGSYCAMALVAPRGPIGTGVLVTNEGQLVSNFTPDGTIRPEYDTGFFVAIENLKKCNKLWISRAAEQAVLGGAYARVAGAFNAGATDAAGPAERGFADPLHYDLTTTDGRINPGAIVFTVDSAAGLLTISDASYNALATGDVVTVTATGGSPALPLPLQAATSYYVIKSATADKISLATTSLNASAGTGIVLTSVGSGTLNITCTAKSITDTFTTDIAGDTITVTSAMYDLITTGDSGTVASTGTLPTGLSGASTTTAVTTAATLAGTTLSVSTTGISVGMAVSGPGIATATTVASVTNGTALVLSKPVTSAGVSSGASIAFATTVATTASSSASTTLSVPTSGLAIGMAVTGTGIAANTTVSSITNGTTLVLSSAATVTSGASITFTTTLSTTAATASPFTISAPTSGLAVGMGVTGTNVPVGATVTSITNGTALVLSAAVTGAGVSSGATLTFTTLAVTYYVYKTPVVNKLQFCSTLSNAQNGVAINLTAPGSGVLTFNFASVTSTPAGQDKALLLYAADPGAYNNNLSYTLTNYATNPSKVREPNAFLIQIYYNGVALPNESWVCAFDPSHKDGHNQSIYVVDVLQNSAYVRAAVNPLLAANATVGDVLVPVAFNGGSDGLAITDSTMIRALNVLSVTDKYPVRFVHDGGWSTPAYQLAVIQFAESRGLAAAFVAPPYSVESTSNALNDVVSYYQNLGSQSSFAGIFSSHVKVADAYNNRQLWISPVGDVAAEYSEKFDKFDPGQPVGGQYGTLSVLDVVRHWTDGEMDFLYDNNVNPIRSKLGKGIQIWGQKTLQSRPSDLDRLNARMLLMAIEPTLRDSYESFLFTRNSVSNDVGTRRQLTLLTDNYMSTVQARGGVYAWKTICSDVNNSLVDVQNERINIWLLVQIVKAVEYIPFTIGITPTSVSLDIAQTFLQTSG